MSYQFSSDAIALVPKKLAHASRLLPLKVEGRVLECGVADPVDYDQVSYFQTQVCREISLVKMTAAEVEQGLKDAYGVEYCAEAFDLVDSVSLYTKPRLEKEDRDSPRRNTGPMKVIAVTSGKGGVGKSSLTLNMALALAKRGYRVGMIDCDFGLSNLHVMMHVRPQYNLSDVVKGRVAALDAFEKVEGGLYLLAGAPGASEFADLNYEALQKAGAGFSALDSWFDFLFLDTAAGIHDGVMSLLLAADETLLVMSPDPSSILDAYVTGKALLDRRPTATIKCVVNEAGSETDAKLIFAKFKTFVGLNTGGNAEFLGKVAADKAAVQAGRTRSPFVISAPNCQASRDVDQVACRLAKVPEPANAQAGLLGKLFGKIKAA